MGASQYRRWQCSVCGEIYDEAEGCAESGIAPGTRFEDLPPDWICPACGSAKDQYTLVED